MKKFSPATEKAITRAIVSEFASEFIEYTECDCIIIGGGPSGLVAGLNIARAGKKVLIVERNNYLGGGFWSGGYLMNKVTVRHPGERVLDEIGVPYKSVGKGLVVADAPHACAQLIASACDSGVVILNMTMLEDLVVKEERVCGAVINWSPIASLPKAIAALDPVAIEAPVLIDATGHDASAVKKLEEAIRDVQELNRKLNTKIEAQQRDLIKIVDDFAFLMDQRENAIVLYGPDKNIVFANEMAIKIKERMNDEACLAYQALTEKAWKKNVYTRIGDNHHKVDIVSSLINTNEGTYLLVQAVRLPDEESKRSLEDWQQKLAAVKNLPAVPV